MTIDAEKFVNTSKSFGTQLLMTCTADDEQQQQCSPWVGVGALVIASFCFGTLHVPIRRFHTVWNGKQPQSLAACRLHQATWLKVGLLFGGIENLEKTLDKRLAQLKTFG